MKEVVEALRSAKRVAIVSHRDPDGDTIGSAVALGLALESLGKQVTLHCADPVPSSFAFIRGTDRIRSDAPDLEADVLVTVDLGDLSRAKLALRTGMTLINIDHHASNTRFGTIDWVDATSAATGEMVARLIDALGAQWTPAMATATLLAIMTDTGSFQFPNTDGRVLELAARCVSRQADLSAITYNVFRSRRFEATKLWGQAFARIQRDLDGELVWTWIGREDLEGAGGRDEDATGLIEQIARSTGMRVALLFNGVVPGEVKVSCRTVPFAPLVDAAALMGGFGGGGHARAAGAIVRGTVDEVSERVLAEARAALQAALQAAAQADPPQRAAGLASS
ncbi:MAG: DHH family phosphoesterase [Candidatus Limnocylindria bacterium]